MNLNLRARVGTGICAKAPGLRLDPRPIELRELYVGNLKPRPDGYYHKIVPLGNQQSDAILP